MLVVQFRAFLVLAIVLLVSAVALSEDRFFDSGGVRIRYTDEGKGPPVVLIVRAIPDARRIQHDDSVESHQKVRDRRVAEDRAVLIVVVNDEQSHADKPCHDT